MQKDHWIQKYRKSIALNDHDISNMCDEAMFTSRDEWVKKYGSYALRASTQQISQMYEEARNFS